MDQLQTVNPRERRAFMDSQYSKLSKLPSDEIIEKEGEVRGLISQMFRLSQQGGKKDKNSRLEGKSKKLSQILLDTGITTESPLKEVIKEFDEEYFKTTIREVTEGEEGYSMIYENGGSFYLPKSYGLTPKIGDDITSYGSIGRSVHGIDINEEEAYYRTPEEREEHRQKILADIKKQQAVREENHQLTLEEKVNTIEGNPFEFSETGENDWAEFMEKNQDAYGFGVIQFAHAWAKAMEVEISAGKKVSDIAKETERQSDPGVTGFMYGATISILDNCWKHGDELRQWHNIKTQIGNEGEAANKEGGTLNPAIVNIGT